MTAGECAFVKIKVKPAKFLLHVGHVNKILLAFCKKVYWLQKILARYDKDYQLAWSIILTFVNLYRPPRR